MIHPMTEEKTRRAICEVGQKLYDKGFVVANDGNISVKISEDSILVTPTGISKGGMDPNSLVKMNLKGEILSGTLPSSEVKLHLRVYQLNPLVSSVVHAHPPLSTAFAVARIPLDRPILAESIVTLGTVPVAPYALPGTDCLALSITPYVKDHNAVLLANHGLLTWGEDLTQAFFRMESAEHYCKILYYLSNIGTPQEFRCEEVDALIKLRESLGITTGGVPSCRP